MISSPRAGSPSVSRRHSSGSGGCRRAPKRCVVVTPARGDEFALDARREDLGVLLLFTAALGALAAVWSSGIAARSLARPVGALREAALAIAAGREARALGQRTGLGVRPGLSRLRPHGRGPRDEPRGARGGAAPHRRGPAARRQRRPRRAPRRRDPHREPARRATAGPAAPAARCIHRVAGRAAGARDRALCRIPRRRRRGRRLRHRRFGAAAARSTDAPARRCRADARRRDGARARAARARLGRDGAPGGARDQEPAHADSARGAAPAPGAIATDAATSPRSSMPNVTRVLAEIDRLDEIARAFSRYGTAPDQRAPAVAVDALAVVPRRAGPRAAGGQRRAMDAGRAGRPARRSAPWATRTNCGRAAQPARERPAGPRAPGRGRACGPCRAASPSRCATTGTALPPRCCRRSSSRISRRAPAVAGSGSPSAGA